MWSELAVVALFAVAACVAFVARRFALPYTVALVVAGLLLGRVHLITPPHLTKELLFAVFLPALIFEAAFAIDARELWRNKLAVSALAFPGVVVGMVATAVALVAFQRAIGVELAWGTGFLFAAIVAATDPIAVVAVFRAVGAPHRLRLLLEGESLLNDGTGIVLFSIVLGAVTTGSISIGGAVVEFVRVVGIGIAAGAVVGLAAAEAIRRIDDVLIETTVTTVAAYGSFLLAEHFGGSGVIATVAAALVCGNYGARPGMSASTRLAVANFWDYAAFAMNSIVFLLLGFQVPLFDLVHNWQAIALAYLAMTAGRAVVVAIVGAGLRRTAERVDARWGAVLCWGGMRGGLSMVLALALPTNIAGRETIVAVTFGVVLVSILLQGSSTAFLLRKLGLARRAPPDVAEVERLRAAMKASLAALDEVDGAVRAHEILESAAAPVRDTYRARIDNLEARLHELGAERIVAVERREIERRALLKERASLLDTARAGHISDDVLAPLKDEIDRKLADARNDVHDVARGDTSVVTDVGDNATRPKQGSAKENET